MKSAIRYAVLITALLIPACGFSNETYSVVPQPVSLEPQDGAFTITPATQIVADEKTHSLAWKLNEMLSPATGFQMCILKKTEQKTNIITLTLDCSLEDKLGPEGYQLDISKENIQVKAAKEAGLFYGFVTIKQLLPPAIYNTTGVKDVTWSVPCVKITDYPRFQWRGMHLDVCRHFMPKEFVKKYIDLIAMHKMNRFHWHLTEDQGWRIEIKKYPKLTDIGAWRKETVVGKKRSNIYDGTPHGGYYTQDEVREIVAYAAERFITVIPEIEMPGHTQAALAAYPEFSCSGGPFEVLTDWVAGQDVYCAGNDQTIQFLKDVLTEVMELFPSQFIHIGGDERPADKWEKCSKCQARVKALKLKDENELQSWFIKQMDNFLSAKGRRLIGWDEILEGGLAPGATVMSWRGTEGGIAAAKAGHDVVMAPTSHTYFVFYQGDPATEPFGYDGLLPLEKVYSYEPVPESLTPVEVKHILGAQGQVWTEYMPNPQHAEYMAFPRMCALAEVVWTPAKEKDYDNFYQRLEKHTERLKVLNVNFRPLDK